MKIDGFFVNLAFKYCKPIKPSKISTNDSLLLIASKNNVFPKIIPPDYLQRFKKTEKKAMGVLLKYSLDSYIGRFVPINAYSLWEKENSIVFEEFNKNKNKLINSYDEIFSYIENSNKDFINSLWNLIHKDGGNPHNNFAIELNKKIKSMLPDKEFLYNNINFHTLVFSIKTDNANLNYCEKILIEQIKAELIELVNSAFWGIINNYKHYKSFRSDALKRFEDKLKRIKIIYCCGDITSVIENMLNTLYGDNYLKNPNDFINKLILNKDLIINNIVCY